MKWEPVTIYGHGLQEHLGREWLCDPAWDIHALYPGPDELIPHPDHDRAGKDPGGDYPERDEQRAVFWDRHVDHRFHIDYPPSRRDGPRTVGTTIGDPEREWDAVIEHRNLYLREAELSLESPAEDIARCLADTFRCFSYFKDKPMFTAFGDPSRELTNPVEGLLHKSFCVGCAHAYAALADASGLPCRTIGCGAHRVAEVLVDGRWHMIENTGRHEGNADLHAYFPGSFMEVTMRPEQYPDIMPDKKRDGYWGMFSGQYHFMGGTWQCPKTLRFAAGNVHALYPELDRWGIKSADGRRLPVVLRRGGFYWEDSVAPCEEARGRALEQRRANCPFPFDDDNAPTSDFLYHPFRPGARLRQSVWLDALKGMEDLEITFPFAPEPHIEFNKPLGRQLILAVGDYAMSLTESGAWPPEAADGRGHRHATAVIPPEVLEPDAANQVELRNDTTVTFQHPFIPAAMEPYVTPLHA